MQFAITCCCVYTSVYSILCIPPVYQKMEQVNHNSSQTTKDKLPTGLEGLIESLSAHISGLAHTATMTSEPSASISANDQTPVATNEISRLSDSSGDSSINSIGYVADTSELQQPYESPVKVGTTSNGMLYV